MAAAVAAAVLVALAAVLAAVAALPLVPLVAALLGESSCMLPLVNVPVLSVPSLMPPLSDLFNHSIQYV